MRCSSAHVNRRLLWLCTQTASPLFNSRPSLSMLPPSAVKPNLWNVLLSHILAPSSSISHAPIAVWSGADGEAYVLEEESSALLGAALGEGEPLKPAATYRKWWPRTEYELWLRPHRFLVLVVLLSFFLGAVSSLALYSIFPPAATSSTALSASKAEAVVGESAQPQAQWAIAGLGGGGASNDSDSAGTLAAALLASGELANANNNSSAITQPSTTSTGSSVAASACFSTSPMSSAEPALSASPSTGRGAFNFTVDSVLPPSRWPQLIDPSQPVHICSESSPAPANQSSDPFSTFSPSRFTSQLRGVVISMFTPGQSGDLNAYFALNDRLLLSPMSSHSDYVIFYTMFPSSSGEELHAQLLNSSTLACEELTVSANLTSRRPELSDLYSRLRHPSLAYPLYLPAVREFLSPLGTHIITVPVAVNLPAHVAADVGQLLRPDWMGCMGVRRSLDYALFSGAVFPTQLIFHPLLRGYDYFIKLDLDIQFVRPPPVSLFQAMEAQQCVWMHSQYNSGSEDCELEGSQAVDDWANRTHHTTAASAGHSWWGSLHYFYGNFIGGWLGWLRSAENEQLATFLYEDRTRPGYFSHRWGDQPTFAKMVGMWFNLSNEQVRGQPPAYSARWADFAVNGTATAAASELHQADARGATAVNASLTGATVSGGVTFDTSATATESRTVSAVCDFTFLRHVAFEHH